jgi:hypothetical protein
MSPMWIRPAAAFKIASPFALKNNSVEGYLNDFMGSKVIKEI